MKTRAEAEYKSRISGHLDKIIAPGKNSVQEGFEFFATDEYTSRNPKGKPTIINKLRNTDLKNIPKMIYMMGRIMKSMQGGIKRCYTDINQYLDELDQNDRIAVQADSHLKSFPNEEIWDSLKKYAMQKWELTVGFAECGSDLVFTGKGVLFPYALVLIQEMDKAKIAKAPEMAAGGEVMRVYNSLGLAVNDIAEWLRKTYNIKCQSNHPLGGISDTVPLAHKAGLGIPGHSGLLISKEFGTRHRIAPIFIQEKLFNYTYSEEYQWVQEFCRKCRKCERACPSNAILPEKKYSDISDTVFSKRTTSINREKCYPYFNKTMGCSVCIKVCPFSNIGYEKIKNAFLKN